jgi:hypothetical protein
MAAIPFALSIHHFISSVGADVGFASIIGLAILVLLFFAQARETASLRRRADEAEEQLQALHLYVDRLSRPSLRRRPPRASPPGRWPGWARPHTRRLFPASPCRPERWRRFPLRPWASARPR